MGLPTLAFASSYTSSFYFDSTLKGTTRSYDGKNIAINTSTSSSGGSTIASSSEYKIELYRQKTFGQDYIGKVNHPRNGSKTSSWGNVGAGKYFFHFVKGIDGHEVRGTAKMYNN